MNKQLVKGIIIALLIEGFVCVIAFGQSPYKQVADQNKKLVITPGWEVVISFDALNGAYIQDAETSAKYAHRADSTKWAIVRTILQIKKVDLARISNNSDSTKVTPEGIFLKLKPKKKQ